MMTDEDPKPQGETEAGTRGPTVRVDHALAPEEDVTQVTRLFPGRIE